jgi:hypothetical protein
VTTTFVVSETGLKGKRVQAVATIIDRLAEAGVGEPLTFEELLEDVEHPHQYTPALIALELVGAVRRWEYRGNGSKRTQTAYSLENTEIEV